jgi:putative tryptophan/tyrosine transport system substrate-binding protein
MSDMRRREFIGLLGGAVAWPLAGRAQQVGRMRRVAILMPFPKGDAEYAARVRAFQQELEKLGWVEGVTIQFDERWTTDNMDIVRAETAALVASNPDAVLATGARVIPILLQLSRSIPIVIPGSSDPVWGWVGDELGAAGRQYHRFYVVGVLDCEQVVRPLEADYAYDRSRRADLQSRQSKHRVL